MNVTTHDLVGWHVSEGLEFLSNEVILLSARLASSQMLDERESAFSFPLSATRYFFQQGVIFSTEVARDAALVAPRTEATGVMGVPFSMTCTTFFS